MLAGLLASLVVGLPLGAATTPSIYNGDAYGECSYGNSCVTTTPPPSTEVTNTTDTTGPTTVQLPSGVRVTINLYNGQVIPQAGYTIVVAPQDSSANAVGQVTFYIDGVQVHTQAADASGAVRWLWEPLRYPGTHLELIITDKTGQTKTQPFTVAVGGAQLPAGAPAAASSGDPVARFFSAFYKPVIYTFPYLLYVLLGVNALLLLLQERRELTELRAVRLHVQRAHTLAEQKDTFISLTSHYLRTPLTILLGGLDLLQSSGNVEDLPALQAAGEQLRLRVEQLVERSTTTKSAQERSNQTPSLSWWKRLTVFGPVLLFGAVALAFDYLANQAADLPVTDVNALVQVLLFGGVALATVLAFRQLQLRRRDRHMIRNDLSAAAELAAAQDALLHEAATQLRQDLERFVSLLPQNIVQDAFIQNGLQRFKVLLDKFSVAVQLQGTQSTHPAVSMQASAVLAQAIATLPADKQPRLATIHLTQDGMLWCQSQGLLAYVIASLLDNALAYSEADAPIVVQAHRLDTGSELIVTDHGQGMTPEFQAQAFQPFAKAEGAEDFTHEGMGFSLYLNKLIMTYLGGTIALASEPGHGTTVTLQLPAPAKLQQV